MRRIVLLLLLVVACEPIVPDTAQEVIVVTNTPTEAPDATPTPPIIATIPPTQLLPTPTPTENLIPTATLPPCDQTEGTLLESAFNSEIADELIPYNLYLPPCFFSSGRRFPFLILMHGSGYTFEQWEDINIADTLDVNITAGILSPMLVVMPEGGVYQENNVFDPGLSYEDIILSELIPHIERDFCVWLGADGRALGGISRGGFWAFSIAFRHPDLFTTVGGHSPFFVPDNAPPSHNPLVLAENAAGIENLSIYLDNAQDDSGGPNTIVFSNTLRERGIVHTYSINPVGGHNNDYWQSNLGDYLAFYGENWPKSMAEYPTCQ